MLCDCFGNMIRVPLTKLIEGKSIKTGEVVRVCDRCGFALSEDEYQKWIAKQALEGEE